MFFAKESGTGAAGAPLGRRFRLLLTSVTVSSLGDGMRFVALPLLAARISGDPRDLALVATMEQLPWLLLSLPAGALADRVDRRRLLVTVDTARTLLVAGFAAAVALGAAGVPLLAAVGFLLGCGQTFYNAGWSGVVPSLVEPADRPRANGRLQAGALVADSLIGTSLGTVLFAAAALLPFAVDATSFASAALLMLLLPGGLPRRDQEPGETVGPRGMRALFGGAGEGVRKLLRHRLLTALCLTATAVNLVMAGVTAVLVLYTRQVLHLGPLGYGLLVGAFAVGGVAGSLGAPWLVRRLGSTWTLLVTLTGAGLVLGVAGLTSDWRWADLATACYGALTLAWGVTAVSIRQDLVPERLLGRISMAYQMLANGGMAVGAMLAGLVAHAWGLRAPMMGGAAVLLVITPGLAWVLRDPKALAQQVAGTQAPTQAATGSSRLAPEPAGVE
ncbi:MULTISPECIES: MFS transporter [Kitasatospora]|uniref:MFS transporter n=1 Tax=Kitasatospora TaxID=2063 RepID=UPI000C70E451|nr:MFS transporter [Kitasatospora sp. GP30]MDH6142309.1 MFS family permease [Kitasatospora sp. GP30]